DANDTSTISTVSIPTGPSSTSFKYNDPKAGAPTITAAASGLTNATQLETVNAGAFVKLQLLLPGETAAPGTATGKTGSATARTSGVAFNVTVNAVDANWNVVTSVSDIVGLTSTDTIATVPANASLSSGGKIFSVTLNTVGSATLTTSDISDSNKTSSTSPSLTVGAGAATKLQVLLPGETAAPGTPTGKTGTPLAQVAGTAIANGIIVNAVDANWNIANTAVPNVTITATDSNASIADDNGGTTGNMTLVAGTRTLSSLTFKTTGTRTINASASGLTAGTSANVTVNPGAFTKLQLLVPGETAAPGSATGKTGTPNGQLVGVSFDTTVNAVDANWNVVGSVSDVVDINSSDLSASLPPDAALFAGTGTFTLYFGTNGNFTLTATDTSDGSK